MFITTNKLKLLKKNKAVWEQLIEQTLNNKKALETALVRSLNNRKKFKIGREFTTVHDPISFMAFRRQAAGLP